MTTAQIDALAGSLMQLHALEDRARLDATIAILGRHPEQLLDIARRIYRLGNISLAGTLAQGHLHAASPSLEALIMVWLAAIMEDRPDAEIAPLARQNAELFRRGHANDRNALPFILMALVAPLLQILSATAHHRRLLRLFDLTATLIPDFRIIFDELQARIDGPRPETQSPPPVPRNVLRRYECRDGPARPARVIVAGRRHWYDEHSMLHEIEPRIYEAFCAYGWQVERQSIVSILRTSDIVDAYRRIAAAHAREPADLIFVDHVALGASPPGTDLVRALRDAVPGAKLVFYYQDPWESRCWDRMRAVAPMADLIWSPFPSLSLWREPVFAGRVSTVPVPHGIGVDMIPPPSAIGTPAFHGAVSAENVPRVFWLLGLALAEEPVAIRKTDWKTKEAGLTAIESYAAYLQRLAASGTGLNFCLRITGERIYTGRALELPYSGSLLIQERSPDVDAYLNEDEHYLGFSSLSELRQKLAWTRDHPREAEEIRRAGTDFVRDAYADRRIVGHLDLVLRGREA